MAIASATLEHLIQNIRCKTLFITHYPHIAMEIEKKHPQQARNMYMGFTEESRIDGRREITFLYKLTQGIALESFGIECARLAGLSELLLNVAIDNSQNMRRQVEERARRVR
jgi:DNA mismatch repair protein MSH3